MHVSRCHRILQSALLSACFALSWHTAVAQIDPQGRENFLSSAEALIPPNCLTDPLPGPAGTTTEGVVSFPITEASSGPRTNVRIRVWRAACHEPERSAVLLRFENVSGDFIAAPFLGPLLIGNQSSGFSSASYRLRANDFSAPTQLDLQTSWFLNNGVSAPYLIEIGPLLPGQDSNDLDVSEYQQAFGLTFLTFNNQGELTEIDTVTVPAAGQSNMVTQFANPPLSGRFSGNWIARDTRDQGILLSISELPDRRLVAFLAWFTYGADGEQAWFTGNTFFDIGSSQISFNINQGSDGQFQSDQPANRTVVGAATLRVLDCSQLELQFNLDSVGLGANTVVLERVLAGEIAGYACRDLPARSQ